MLGSKRVAHEVQNPTKSPSTKEKKKLNHPNGYLSFLGCGSGIWTSRPSGYEPDELPNCSIPRYYWCRKPGSNRYEKLISRDFKSRASANSAIPAYCDLYVSVLPIHYSILYPDCQYLFNLFSKKLKFYIDFRSEIWYYIWALCLTLNI